VPTAPWAAVDDLDALRAAIDRIGLPAVLKTTRLGYDGKGQALLRRKDDIADAFAALSPKPLILEGFVDFGQEISVVAARALDGAYSAFDTVENRHRDHDFYEGESLSTVCHWAFTNPARDMRNRLVNPLELSVTTSALFANPFGYTSTGDVEKVTAFDANPYACRLRLVLRNVIVPARSVIKSCCTLASQEIRTGVRLRPAIWNAASRSFCTAVAACETRWWLMRS